MRQHVIADLEAKLDALRVAEGIEAAAVLVGAYFKGSAPHDVVGHGDVSPSDVSMTWVIAIVRTRSGIVVLHNFKAPVQPLAGRFQAALGMAQLRPSVELVHMTPIGTAAERRQWDEHVQKILTPRHRTAVIPPALSWDAHQVGFIRRFANGLVEMRGGINCFNREDEDEGVKSFDLLAEDILRLAVAD